MAHWMGRYTQSEPAGPFALHLIWQREDPDLRFREALILRFEVGDRVYLRVDQRPTGTIVAESHRHLGYHCVVVRLDSSGLHVLARARDARPTGEPAIAQRQSATRAWVGS